MSAPLHCRQFAGNEISDVTRFQRGVIIYSSVRTRGTGAFCWRPASYCKHETLFINSEKKTVSLHVRIGELCNVKEYLPSSWQYEWPVVVSWPRARRKLVRSKEVSKNYHRPWPQHARTQKRNTVYGWTTRRNDLFDMYKVLNVKNHKF